MKYGLSEKQLQEIKGVLASYEAVEAAVLFGSRASDTYKEASDIDIVIKGEQADFMLAAKIKGHFEDETYLPFFFDIISYNSIDNDELKKHIKTKGKILYRKGWRTCTLGDVAEFHNSKRIPLSKLERSKRQGKYPYYGASGVIDHVDDYLFDGEYVLISEDGENLKTRKTPICFKASGKFWVNNHAHILKGFLPHHNNWIVYLFANLDLNQDITGAVQPKLSKSSLESITFQIPPIAEQKAIGEVLSSLDDKIDLLHSQNKTLESLAETLFRHHFIENAQDDWEEKPLSYFVEIVCGKTPSKKKHEYFEGYIPFIKIPDMHGKAFISSTTDTLTEEGKASQINKTLPPLSICVSCIATVGLVSMNIVESQTNQQINSIIPNKDIYRYFLYILMKNSTDLLIAMASGGTATLNLNTGNFSTIPVQSPPEKLLEKFNEEVKPMFEKILSNTKQIQTLEKLRDTLLPKLISGDVRVQYKEVA